ncbi:putative transcriptional regulatory protein C3C7.04 [Lasiodiplodia hormozganensis]|uniref:Transcriptional regulatory protein C3C7.04 n=1 Tax=Lasiodiplodia hormozganensis TaxID=869390 RepID=A0AA39XPW0_9PEZI|nr:putative transcriptional regulatory protein C3C7.04 [Lasiodiplodia hormozganensis]
MPTVPKATSTEAEAQSTEGEAPSTETVSRQGRRAGPGSKSIAYIDGLLEEIERLKRQNAPITPQSHATAPSLVPETVLPPGTIEHDGVALNPALNAKPWFDSVNVFRTPILIGEAADNAFATRFRQAISDPQAPEPTHLLRINYITDEPLMNLAGFEVAWPSPSRARFLIGAALNYVSRCYCLVRRSSVMEGLEQSIRDPTWGNPLLHCKFWALFAVGELCSTRSVGTQGFPGIAFFSQSLKVLGLLDELPGLDSIELLLLISFYSMALHRRYSAYILAGTAMRSAIVAGLHLNVPESQLPDPGVREHRKRLFWIAYIFDRMWASKLGHPPAIQDDDIGVDLPSEPPVGSKYSNDFTDSAYHVANIRLTSLLTKVIRSVYSLRKQNQGDSLSTRVHQSLKDLQSWVESLPPQLQIDHSSETTHDLKTISLHLAFNQCVILATRPVLLHTLRSHIADLRSRTPSSSPAPPVPASASTLAEASIRCARHSFRLLTQSWIDGSFATFDCHFTQYLFSALTILAVSSLLETKDSGGDRDAFEEAARLLDQLRAAGSCVAQEYGSHVEAMRAAVGGYVKRTTGEAAGVQQQEAVVSGGRTAETVGMTSAEPSLRELLEQPFIDLQFLEDAVDYEGLYWPDLSAGAEDAC